MKIMGINDIANVKSMIANGYTDFAISMRTGFELREISLVRRNMDADEQREAYYKKTQQLCWTCINACPKAPHGCSWSRSGVLVDGCKYEENAQGYLIKECPQYESDDTEEARKERLEACVRLLGGVK